MDITEIISIIKNKHPDIALLESFERYTDEFHIKIKPEDFQKVALVLHKTLRSPCMALFAVDEMAVSDKFVIKCVFLSLKHRKWVFTSMDIPSADPRFDSISRTIFSAGLFEREIMEMFGIKPEGNPDLRRLKLHDEVWPAGNFPLRKDFNFIDAPKGEYRFTRVEGEGIFEVPVGPVHAGIIGPGHFRFSAAGEPIINLEIRLGFTHRGVEKLFEGKYSGGSSVLAECVSGDSCFAHSIAFSKAIEKICGKEVPENAKYMRGIFLELERMYNHANDIGGIAVDVGFSFAQSFASIIKEEILAINERLTGHRYLKNVNFPGGILVKMDGNKRQYLARSIKKISGDFNELNRILFSSVSFMDRADTTGILRKKTAEDLGISGVAGRASGIQVDLRKHFSDIYRNANFKIVTEAKGDVLSRLKVRMNEVQESARLIEDFLGMISHTDQVSEKPEPKAGEALGYAEGWRGPVLYWVKTDSKGIIERCKIVDASFNNWQGLSYAVLGNIIPDFPLCNKSFDLSYSGNDL